MQVISEVENPIIGKFYLVPCYKGRPVMGSLHEDSKHLNFPHQHMHYDWRFITYYYHTKIDDLKNNSYMAKVMIIDNFDESEFKLQKKKLRRQSPVFPNIRGFMNKIENVYLGKKINCNRCPHKGYDMSKVAADADGVKYCPLHGLKFKDKTVVGRSNEQHANIAYSL